MRTHWCGELRPEHAGQTVSLCGWVARRREHGEHLAFLDLRDREGVVQCVIDGSVDVRNEWVVRVTGVVRTRPEGTENPALPTGQVEVGECTVEVLNRAEPPPFPVDDRVDTDEVVRLRHRYVDLRRERLQRNLRSRAAANSAIRSSMERQGFVEVETPMLIASTPEGARDFVVPSRLHPGSFYALPQSPQLFKQLTMVGGLDRYYQIARCLRDEDLRADRQFEFMQLDVEASFVGQDEVLAFVSDAVAEATRAVAGAEVGDIPTMTWHDAMERYGSDKPDVRFGMELVELTEVFASTGFKAFAGQTVKGIRVPGAGTETSRKRLDDLTDAAKRWGAKGLVWMRVTEDALDSPVAKFLSDGELGGVRAALDAEPGDLLLLVADARPVVRRVLGLLRLELGRPPVTEGGLHFLWVVDFPLFEGLGDDGPPVHHAPPRGPRPAVLRRPRRPAAGAVPGVRPGAQRLGAGLGLGPDPPGRRAAVDLRAARHLPGRGPGPLRVPARRLPLRGAAPCRLRLRDRSAGGAAGGRGEHPRGDRLPQDAVGCRPVDPGPDAHRSVVPGGAGPAHASAPGLRCHRPRPSPGCRRTWPTWRTPRSTTSPTRRWSTA
jgi:aspartyl-tRNA synthetase